MQVPLLLRPISVTSITHRASRPRCGPCLALTCFVSPLDPDLGVRAATLVCCTVSWEDSRPRRVSCSCLASGALTCLLNRLRSAIMPCLTMERVMPLRCNMRISIRAHPKDGCSVSCTRPLSQSTLLLESQAGAMGHASGFELTLKQDMAVMSCDTYSKRQRVCLHGLCLPHM